MITLKQQKFSQSNPVLIRQFSKKLQSDLVLIRPKLASKLHQRVLTECFEKHFEKETWFYLASQKETFWHSPTSFE